jgi:hypothetical protein
MHNRNCPVTRIFLAHLVIGKRNKATESARVGRGPTAGLKPRISLAHLVTRPFLIPWAEMLPAAIPPSRARWWSYAGLPSLVTCRRPHNVCWRYATPADEPCYQLPLSASQSQVSQSDKSREAIITLSAPFSSCLKSLPLELQIRQITYPNTLNCSLSTSYCFYLSFYPSCKPPLQHRACVISASLIAIN